VASSRGRQSDEPTGSLDHVNAKAILSTFMDIKERMQTTIVLVTHDAAVASYCDTVVFIENGRVCDTLRKEETAQPFYERIVTVSSKVRGVI